MLTDLHHAILNLERQHWKYAGTKEEAIGRLGLSPTRYYAILNALLDDPAALEADPLLVRRLTRLRDARRRRHLPVA